MQLERPPVWITVALIVLGVLSPLLVPLALWLTVIHQ